MGEAEPSMEELARRCLAKHPEPWSLDAVYELGGLALARDIQLSLKELTDLVDVARGFKPGLVKILAGRDQRRLGGRDQRRPLQHPELFATEPTTGQDRLRIGGGQDSPRLLAALASRLTEPLYILVVNRGRVSTEGRYESTPKSLAEVLGFIDEYHDLFADDCRADLWVGSVVSDGLVVLDEHDFVFAYGELDLFSDELLARGYRAGHLELPFPHEHRVHDELDSHEESLANRSDWNRIWPLAESDRS